MKNDPETSTVTTPLTVGMCVAYQIWYQCYTARVLVIEADRVVLAVKGWGLECVTLAELASRKMVVLPGPVVTVEEARAEKRRQWWGALWRWFRGGDQRRGAEAQTEGKQ